MAKKLTSKDVYDYVTKLTGSVAVPGRGTAYPKLREVCRHFGARQDVIEELIEEGTDEGYLGLAVAMGNSSGIYEIDRRGDCLVEAY